MKAITHSTVYLLNLVSIEGMYMFTLFIKKMFNSNIYNYF